MDDTNVSAATPAEAVTTPSAPADEPVDLNTAPQIEDEPKKEAPVDAAGDDEPKEDEPKDEPKKNIPGSQRLKRRLQLVETDFLNVQQELTEARRQLEELRTPKEKQEGTPGVDREPQEKDFPGDYLAYDRALTQWRVRETFRQELGRLQKADQEQKNRHADLERRQALQEAYEESASLARERIPDFDKVVASAKDLNVKTEVLEELLSSDKSALLQYHLSKNPDKVRELNALGPRELARAIGRLEASIHLPKAKTTTTAPAPLSQPKGGAQPSFNPFSDDVDMNEYVKWRQSQGYEPGR